MKKAATGTARLAGRRLSGVLLASMAIGAGTLARGQTIASARAWQAPGAVQSPSGAAPEGPLPAPPQSAPTASQNPSAVAPDREGAAAQTFTVPAGAKVLLSLKSAINTRTAQPGDGVYLVSSFPVVVGSRVLIPSGVYVQGVVDQVDRPGRVKGRARLLMHFTTMIFPNGQVVEIPGTVNRLPGSAGPTVKDGEGRIEQAGSKGKDAGTVAKGAEIGAEGGAIAGAVGGNPLGGIGYGALAGAAGGLLYTLFTRGNEIVIPEGTGVEMVLQRPLVLQPSQLAGMHGDGAPLVPVTEQPRPLPKPGHEPGHLVCPPDSLGCS